MAVPIWLILAFNLLLVLAQLAVAFLHEMGHALAARWAGSGCVDVYVGSYGERRGAWRLRPLPWLTLWLTVRPFRGGLCAPRWTAAPSAWRQAVYILAGPLAPAAVAGLSVWLVLAFDAHAAVKLTVFTFAFLAFFGALANLWPRRRTVAVAATGWTCSDGYQLYRLARGQSIAQHFLLRWHNAVDLAKAGRHVEALPVQRELLAEAPSAALLNWTYDTYLHLGDYAGAVALTHQYVAVAQASEHAPRYRAERGFWLALGGQLEAAWQVFDADVHAYPENDNARANRGYTSLLLGQHAAAVADFDHVLARDPANAYAHVQRGRACLERGEPVSGLRQIRHGLALDPQQSYGHLNLGRYHAERGDHDQALVYFEHAAHLDPRTHDLAAQLATCQRHAEPAD